MDNRYSDLLYAKHFPVDGECPECQVEFPCEAIQVLRAWSREQEAIVGMLARGHLTAWELAKDIAHVINHWLAPDSETILTEPDSETKAELTSPDAQDKLDQTCDHMVYVNEGKPVLTHASLCVTYCPKCGEKL